MKKYRKTSSNAIQQTYTICRKRVQRGKKENDVEATYVVLPADAVERDRIDVLVKDECDGDGEVEYVEALGAH